MINRVLEEEKKLAAAIGLTEVDIESDYENVEDIIRYLNERLYRTEIKKIDLLHHPAYVGIRTLYSETLQFMVESNWFPIETFDDLTRAFALLHSTNGIDANLECIVKDVNNPLLSKCICFKEELKVLDMSQEKNREFAARIQYLLGRDWIIEQTKIEVAIAKVYLREPLRYYKAYIGLHKDTFLKVVNEDDYVEAVLDTKNIEKEKMLVLLIDIKERGYTLDDVFWR